MIHDIMQNVECQNLACITCLVAQIIRFHSYLNDYGIFAISLYCDSTTFFVIVDVSRLNIHIRLQNRHML